MDRQGEAFHRREVQTAPEVLGAEVPIFDLSPYEQPADAGILAGPTKSRFEHVAVGAGREAATDVAGMTGVLRTAGHGSHEVGDHELDAMVDHLLQIGEQTERSLVFALAEAITRGIIDHSDAGSPAQWISGKAPCLEPAQVTRIVRAANLINDPRHATLRAVLADGRVTVRGLLVAVREAQKVQPMLPRCSWRQALGYFLTIADHGTAKDVTRLAKQIIATYGDDQAPADEDCARAHESLSWWQLPGGMTRVRADLSPADAATFTEAIQALAKPRPGTLPNGDRAPVDDPHADAMGDPFGEATPTSPDGDPASADPHADATDDPFGEATTTSPGDGAATSTGGPYPARVGGKNTTAGKPRDLRTPGKRRADALIELVGAAARVDDRDGGRAGTQASVTVPLSVLIGGLTNAGYATTALGQVLDAATARAMACTAKIIPLVLGTDSQPLDVGRASRTFTPATRHAITARDRGGCTFPGCDRPAPWCEAHHAVPWWVGGRSTLTNGVLLCSRHHHIVHSRGYLPHITETTVIWDLTPARIPTQPLPPDDPLTWGPGAPPDLQDTA